LHNANEDHVTTVSTNELKALADFKAHENLVAAQISAATPSLTGLLRFFGRYASWNGFFGSGVATLAGKIGRSRGLFHDRDEHIDALADRSVLVASYIFDAARDEFDDRGTEYRDTHRDLAQAMISGLIHCARGAAPVSDNAHVNELMAEPTWLRMLNTRVAQGYGAFTADYRENIFSSIGYHLGSELLADQEFTIIDEALRARAPDAVTFLQQHREKVANQDHNAYRWISIHSSHGNAVEEDHFKLALEGVNLAFRFVPEAMHADLRRHLHYGFQNFANDQNEFFSHVNVP
jgi:hypothetical protein